MSLHVYKAVDVSVGAAIWKRLDNIQNGVKAGAPVVTDDSAAGYEQGSQIFDTSHSPYYIWECQNPAAGAAVWVQVYPGGGATGPAGRDGRDGRDGLDGEDGVDGPPGLPGNAGAAGASGSIGPQGPAGRDGLDGQDGQDGAPGIQGNTGAAGAQGSIGPQGNPGKDGFDGQDGQDGTPGIQGNTGAPGAAGAAGVAGRDGRDGFDGQDGQDGTPGIQGNTGAQGSIGPQGNAGRDGLDGQDGQDGSPGIQGNAGAAGSTGSIGPQGNAGRDGQDGQDGQDGAQGIQGNAGTPGSIGPQGNDGRDGLDGEDGQEGAPGAAWNPGLPAANQVFASNYPSAPGFRALTMADQVQTPKWIDGFQLQWSSTTVVLVGNIGQTSSCADKSGAVQITMSGQATVTMTTDGAINGNDSFTGPGTVSTSGASTTITGTGTTFLTSFGTRTGAGTITTVGTAATGTGTSFMDGPGKLFLGDLIGSAAKGYSQVTAIASNTACTLQAAIPGGDLTTSAWNVIESPVIGFGASNQAVIKITSDTSLTVQNATTLSASAYLIGRVLPVGLLAATNNIFYFVWTSTGASGTGCFVSTQRTTPFGVTGYNANVRRIGSILIDAGSIVQFSQSGDDRQRTYTYENAKIGDSTRVLSSGTATAWTAVICSAVVPPTASSINFVLTPTNLVNGLAYLRKRNTGSATVSRNSFVICNVTGGTNTMVPNFPADGAQAVDYANSSATLNTFIDVVGFNEVL